MDQELMIKASLLERQMRELENELEFVDREISELSKFNDNLDYLSASQDNVILSSLGKGVLMKAEIKERKLFVDVGAGVLVRKEPEDIKKILKDQIGRLAEARMRLLNKLHLTKENLISMLKEIESHQSFN
ncbi:MAG: hypothetical protein Q8Q31_02770 [Nanoarchaeota archaeon]|nr:hypothetical protein [Nanoarchaeota archaeon]